MKNETERRKREVVDMKKTREEERKKVGSEDKEDE